jgi:hypothetical protein
MIEEYSTYIELKTTKLCLGTKGLKNLERKVVHSLRQCTKERQDKTGQNETIQGHDSNHNKTKQDKTERKTRQNCKSQRTYMGKDEDKTQDVRQAWGPYLS